MDKHIGDATEMVRPRICEVLGVEVGERFDVKSEICTLYTDAYISEDGIARSKSVAPIGSMRLCEIINGDLKVIRKPRFTQQEVERAKAVRVLWGGVDKLEKCDLHIKAVDGTHLVATMSADLFPSLRPGETVNLDEIIGGAE